MTHSLIGFVEDGKEKDTVVPSNWVAVGGLILVNHADTLKIEWLHNQIGCSMT